MDTELETPPKPILPAPGLHPNVLFDTYLRWPLMSQTTLKAGRDSMAHLKAAWDGEKDATATDDMILGSALGVAFLEPDTVRDRVICWRGGARRGKEWTEFQAEHADKYILTEERYAHMAGMVASLRKHPAVKLWLDQIHAVEVAAIGDINGLSMKGRADALTAGEGPILDLKKVRKGDARAISYAVKDYGYDIQGAVYRELFNRDRFILITVEDFAPYDVVPYELSPAWLRRGEASVASLIEGVLYCQRTGVWPGRCDAVAQLEVPDWLNRAEGSEAVTLNGEQIGGA